MKMFKKLVSVVCAATVLTSSIAFTTSAFNAATVPEEQVAADASIRENVQDGVILHAFNWSYNSIKENLPAIAAAGYSTVQTSPVQQPKDYSVSRDVGGQWWKLYQPVSMQIAQNSWLGTKAELTSLCSEADKYGIKIICDIVSNHFGNEEMGGKNAVSNQVKDYQPDFYNNRSSYFRNNNIDADSDSDTQKIVQGHVSACPDLNTGNTNVQNAVVALLKECIDCGVDGFRFDAAKHIETPDDGPYSSQYWPTITNAAKNYYSQKNGGKSLYIYGEILNTPGNSRNFSSYTRYINVTDNKTGDNITNAVKNGSASGTVKSSFSAGLSGSQIVLWAESHDTYEGSSGNTSVIPDEKIIQSWALVASRKDATALYFVRPGTALMGDAGTDTSYKSTAVSEVNKFHNLFVGKSEKVGYSGSVSYVQRGGNGIVLANIGGAGTTVNISGTDLADGTYLDTVAGGTFIVSGGTLSGTIGKTGVAVVYQGETVPRATSSVENCTFKGETLTVQLSLENAVQGTYCLDDSTPVSFTDGTAIKIGSDYNYGETIHLTLTATGAKGNTETLTYSYKKEQDTSSNIYIWFDMKTNRAKKWKTPLNCYMYDEDTAGDGQKTVYTNAAAWPGEGMTYDEGQDMWYYKVPTTSYLNGEPNSFDLTKSTNAYFIVSGSGNQQQFPASGAHSPKLNAQSWEYTGGTTFKATDRTPTQVVIPATEVTKGQAATTAAPTTAKPTQAPTTVAPTTAKPTQAPTTAVPTTAAPAAKNGIYKANTAVALRSGAGDTYGALDTISKNEQIKVTDTKTVNGHTWGYTVYDDTPGWVDLGYFTFVSDLPVETTAAPTTQKPTQAPTTVAPTTAKPTQVPTTAAPTTQKPTVAPTTQKPTVAPTTQKPTDPQPTTKPQTYLYGDVNLDGLVDIEDATLVQLHANGKAKHILKGIPLILADVNADGNVDIEDATYIQLYSNDSKKDLKLTGTPYVVPVPTTVKPTEVPTTQKPTQAPTTAKPTAAPTTQKPTEAGKSLTVTATSNLFPQATTTFNPVTNQITVTWWVNIQADKMINTQFTITYDNKVLDVDKTDGVNMKYDEDDPTEVANYLILRATKGSDTVINLEPESMPNGGIKGNASRLSGFKVTNNGGRVPFVSVTFNPKDGAEGKTAVDLNVEIIQLGNGTDDTYYLINNSEVVRPDITYLPTDTAVAVYAGPFNGDAQQDPDPEQPTVAPTTQKPTVAPTTAPLPSEPLIVTATSNVFPKASTSFDPGVKRITVTYWINIPEERLINTQFKLSYDKNVLEYDEGAGINQVYDEDDPTEIADYLILRFAKSGTVINTNPSDMPDGGIRGNATKDTGYKVTDNGNRVPFVTVTFKPKAGAYGHTNVNLDVEILQLGTGDPKDDYYVINNSKLVRPDVTFLPTDTAVAVYAGKFNNDVQQKPDEPDPTEPITAEPTTVAPTTAEPTTVAPTTVVPTTVAPTTVAPTEPQPTDPIVNDMTVRFTNNLSWPIVYVYAWGGSASMQWPGIVMTDDGENDFDPGIHNFSAIIPDDVKGYIFNGGAEDNAPQTSNITDFTQEGWFVNKNYTELNDDGKQVYTALYWGFEISGGSKVVKFSNNQHWQRVFVHAWAGETPLTNWPGIQMEDIGDNSMNEGVNNFQASIPDGATGICFTAGENGPQTNDITDLNHEGWYTNSEKDGEGKFVAHPWDGGTSGGSKVVKFSNNQHWQSVFVHAWAGETPLTNWPGIPMEDIGDNSMNEGVNNFQASIPDGATGICFTAGENGPQTNDITDLNHEGWYTNSEKDGEGKFVAHPWDGGTSGGSKVVKFSNNQHWQSVFVHAWAGETPLTNWPGIPMEDIGDNSMNEGVNNFQASIPDGATGICFTAGENGPQTNDITDLNHEGWYTNSEKDGEGKFVAHPWDGGTSGGSKVVKFSNNQHWQSVFVHAWAGETPLTNWPGIPMEDIGDNSMNEGVNNFRASIPDGATGILFTAGANGPQTADITDLNYEGWWISDEMDGNGHYIAHAWQALG